MLHSCSRTSPTCLPRVCCIATALRPPLGGRTRLVHIIFFNMLPSPIWGTGYKYMMDNTAIRNMFKNCPIWWDYTTWKTESLANARMPLFMSPMIHTQNNSSHLQVKVHHLKTLPRLHITHIIQLNVNKYLQLVQALNPRCKSETIDINCKRWLPRLPT